MKIDVNVSGLDKFILGAEEDIKQRMIELSHDGVDYAKKNGEYKNHTVNLRSAPGSAVVIEGEIVDLYVPAEAGHQAAKDKTQNLLIYGKRPKNGIILADGMEYASYVEAKGLDVLSDAAFNIERKARKKFSK